MKSDVEVMKRAGVEFQKYRPLRWYNLSRLNRTHRKLLVVDGRVGFTGGVGIARCGPATRRIRALARFALSR